MESSEQIERLYAHYREVAGDLTAASVLVLAHVMQGDRLASKTEQPAAMLTLKQAAEVLGITPHGLQKIVNRSRRKLKGGCVERPTIRFHQTGKYASIRFRRKWLDDYIEGNAPEFTPPSPMEKYRGRKKRGRSGLDWPDLD
jgi:hypothetical protein